jgi:hypothetical protein
MFFPDSNAFLWAELTNWRSPYSLAGPTGLHESCSNSFSDQCALELGNRAKDLEHQFTRGKRCSCAKDQQILKTINVQDAKQRRMEHQFDAQNAACFLVHAKLPRRSRTSDIKRVLAAYTLNLLKRSRSGEQIPTHIFVSQVCVEGQLRQRNDVTASRAQDVVYRVN